MNILEYNAQLENYANIKTFVVEDHNDNIFSDQQDNSLLNIIHLNIRSLNKNFDNLLILLESLKIKFDLIVLSETWKINNLENFNIEGYDIFYSEGSHNQNDGLVMYVSKNINPKFTTVKFSENTFVKLALEKNNLLFNVVAVYRLPSTNSKNFLHELQNVLSQIKQKNATNIFLGDINIDLHKKDENVTNEYINILAERGFFPYVNHSTRISEENESCLDHCFINISPNITNTINISPIVLKSNITDHYPIIIKLIRKTQNKNTKENINNEQTQTIYNYKILKQLMQSETWQNLFQISDPNLAYESFLNILNTNLEKCSKILLIKSKEKKIKPWITKGLVLAIRKRDKMKEDVNKNKNDIALLNKYKEYRNLTNNLIKKVKRDYYHNIILENKNNIKTVWEIVNESLNEKRSSKKIIIKQNNVDLVNDKDISENFNNFFINVGENMANKIQVDKLLKRRNINGCNNMFLKPISENEIMKTINELKNKSSPGEDKISSKILKFLNSVIAKPLCYIFNLCFEKGIFPNKLKISIVTPVYKTGDRTIVSNYRPISVISNIGKVLEKCIKSRLLEHLNYNKILSLNQYGFTEGMSTDDGMYEVMKDIYNSVDNKKKQIAIFLDLAKAFDTVSHEILINQLNQYGIKGIVNDFFRSYLQNREQCVKIGESRSNLKEIKYGIPQGTVLGPVLFNIYINELLQLPINGKVVAYADDTVLLVEDDSWTNVTNKAVVEFSKLQQWLSENYLTVNLEKTKFMCFSIYDKNVPNIHTLHLHTYRCISKQKRDCICAMKLLQTKTIKYLGIIIDQNLKWTDHIQQLNNKMHKLVWKFYHLKNILPFNTLKTLYHALVESILRYGIIIWGSAYSTNLESLNVSQKHIIKIILGKNKHYSSKLLFKQFNVFNLQLLYTKSVLIFTHKHKNVLNVIQHGYSTRQKYNLNVAIPQIRYTTTLRFITYYGPKFYNLLPAHFKQYNNISLFCKKVSEHIKNNKQNFTRLLV